jgi:hypothetical protein
MLIKLVQIFVLDNIELNREFTTDNNIFISQSPGFNLKEL